MHKKKFKKEKKKRIKTLNKRLDREGDLIDDGERGDLKYRLVTNKRDLKYSDFL